MIASSTDAETLPALRKALDAYCRASLPAPESALRAELGALKMQVRRPREGAEDLEMQARVYARQLSGYPADIALYVLRTQADMDPWWPAWADLSERLAMLSRPRAAQRRALEWLISEVEARHEEA